MMVRPARSSPNSSKICSLDFCSPGDHRNPQVTHGLAAEDAVASCTVGLPQPMFWSMLVRLGVTRGRSEADPSERSVLSCGKLGGSQKLSSGCAVRRRAHPRAEPCVLQLLLLVFRPPCAPIRGPTRLMSADSEAPRKRERVGIDGGRGGCGGEYPDIWYAELFGVVCLAQGDGACRWMRSSRGGPGLGSDVDEPSKYLTNQFIGYLTLHNMLSSHAELAFPVATRKH